MEQDRCTTRVRVAWEGEARGDAPSDLVRDHVDVRAATQRADTVDERHLVELTFGRGDAHLQRI
jgi:hypothetical protein